MSTTNAALAGLSSKAPSWFGFWRYILTSQIKTSLDGAYHAFDFAKYALPRSPIAAIPLAAQYTPDASFRGGHRPRISVGRLTPVS